jgi:hypothetical protein
MRQQSTYNVNDAVQVLEAFYFQHPWIVVVLEMTEIEWDPEAIESLSGKEFGIGICEEVLEKLVEKEVVLFLA